MSNFNVKQKLGFLIAFAILMLVIVGVAGLVGSKRIESALNVMSEEKLPTANTLSDIRTNMATLHGLCLEASLWREKKYAQKYFKNVMRRIPDVDKQLTTAVEAFDKMPLPPEEAEAWQAFKSVYTNWHNYSVRATKAIEQLANIEYSGGNDDEAMEKQKEAFADYDGVLLPWGVVEPNLQKTLSALVEANLKSGQAAVESGASASKASFLATVSIFGVATALLIVLGIWLARGIVKPLDSMRRAIVAVAANNDFTLRVPVTSRDEAGQTAQAFNQLIEQMQSSLREVLDNAARISSAAHSAAEVARQVSDASDNQSESASAMAAAIEEMTVSITHINELTQDALRRAHEAGEAANSGAETISQTNVEMAEIAKTVQGAGKDINEVGVQSNKISMIVQVIKDVADQTNLLALNAAIEAARAGDAGRGFAVVADEVRKLAERTAGATTEIATLVESIQEETRAAREVMEVGASDAGRHSAESKQAVQSMKNLLELSRRMEQAVTSSALLSNVELANIDELTLKLEVYKVFLGVSSLRPEDLPDEKHCRLGRWYYDGEGRERFAGLAGYAELEDPHRAVHVHARRAVELHARGELEAALAELQAMEKANLTVMRGLDKMLEKAVAR